MSAFLLPLLPLLWLACMRPAYRIAVRRDWVRSVRYSGGRPTGCVDYMNLRHSTSKCCPKCAETSREDFGASRRNRIALVVAGGPLLLIGAAVALLVTAGQPLPAAEREARLRQAEADLQKANDELAAVRRMP